MIHAAVICAIATMGGAAVAVLIFATRLLGA